jgi:hypothetical protein
MQLAFSILICLFFSLNTQAQINPIGKTYTAEIGTTCKEFNDGYCTLYIYCILSFEKDIVNISYSQNASCFDKKKEADYIRDNYDSKLYSWSIKNRQIQIKGFTDYGVLVIGKDSLIGRIQNDKVEKLYFILKESKKR